MFCKYYKLYQNLKKKWTSIIMPDATIYARIMPDSKKWQHWPYRIRIFTYIICTDKYVYKWHIDVTAAVHRQCIKHFFY